MKIEETAPESIQDMLQPLVDGRFTFACHPGVPCFTECCRDLRLMLTPYDILRLKNHLQIQSGEFLDRYTETSCDERRNLPVVYLRMTDNERRTCPFGSSSGCQVYADRPAACRIYPIARASRMHRLHGKVIEDFFVLKEDHCLGFREDRAWSTAEWLEDQGLESYDGFNNLWMEIVTHPALRNGAPLSSKQQQMFFMSAYNLDRFRDFVLGSRFLQLFEFDREELDSLADDESLLTLGFKWLRFFLFNEPALKLRREK